MKRQEPEKAGDRSRAEAVVVNTLQIQGIDLEPTEDELDFFLTHESTIGVEDILRIAGQQSSESGGASTEIEKAYEEVVAMNRKNAGNSFSDQAKAAIERKRKQLLEELSRRHEDAE